MACRLWIYSRDASHSRMGAREASFGTRDLVHTAHQLGVRVRVRLGKVPLDVRRVECFPCGGSLACCQDEVAVVTDHVHVHHVAPTRKVAGDLGVRHAARGHARNHHRVVGRCRVDVRDALRQIGHLVGLPVREPGEH